MPSKISRSDIKQKLYQLLSSEEGILILLSGSLVLSDFDDLDEALDEALKAFNSNQQYFHNLIANVSQRS